MLGRNNPKISITYQYGMFFAQNETKALGCPGATTTVKEAVIGTTILNPRRRNEDVLEKEC
jgi:hypothetical protein